MSQRPKYSKVFKNHASAKEMTQRAAVIWEETFEELDQLGLTSKSRLAILDRYVRARVEYDNLYPEAVAQGPISKGNKGGFYFNYLWSAVSKLNDRIMKLEASLLISPNAADGKKIKAKAKAKNKFLSRE